MVAAGAKPRVLVVDDDRDFAESMADVLGLRGYQVDLAYSGEAGVRRCRAADYDVALIDIRMPGVNGVESLVEIRHAKPETRVVLMTGYSVPELIREARNQGAFGVLKKPLDIDALINLIEQPHGSGAVSSALETSAAADTGAGTPEHEHRPRVTRPPTTGPRQGPRAEEARQESERNYRALVEGSAQGVLVDRDFVPLFANQAYAEMLGYDAVDEVLALPSITPHVPEYERERLCGYMQARLRGDPAPTFYECDAVRADGRTVTLQTIARVITWRGEPAVQTVFMDVTERRSADQALRESEQRFRAIAEVTPYALFIARKSDGQILYANETLRQTVGFCDDPLNHKSVELYWDPSERQELLNSLDAHGRRLGHELRHRRADGEMFWAVTSSVEMDFGGEAAMLTAFIDITDRKRAEEALHESEQRFREHLEDLVRSRTEALESTQRELLRAERLAAIGQLTSTVGHELRNPLGTIRTSLFALRDRIDTTEQRTADTLARIERSIERCDNIIQELLDYTRAPKLQRQEVDLDSWLRSLIGDLHLPEEIDVESDLRCDGHVAADIQRLGQAIVNLVNNACQAMVEREGIKRRNTVRISSRAAPTRVEVSVSDAGPGISSDTLERIFEPLFSTRAFGVGLGLPLVKQVMEQHGGGVAVHSVVGEGTTMTLWIPRSAAT